jgi:hypothetical protein
MGRKGLRAWSSERITHPNTLDEVAVIEVLRPKDVTVQLSGAAHDHRIPERKPMPVRQRGRRHNIVGQWRVDTPPRQASKSIDRCFGCEPSSDLLRSVDEELLQHLHADCAASLAPETVDKVGGVIMTLFCRCVVGVQKDIRVHELHGQRS